MSCLLLYPSTKNSAWYTGSPQHILAEWMWYYCFVISLFSAKSQDVSQQALQADGIATELKPTALQLCTVGLCRWGSWKKTNISSERLSGKELTEGATYRAEGESCRQPLPWITKAPNLRPSLLVDRVYTKCTTWNSTHSKGFPSLWVFRAPLGGAVSNYFSLYQHTYNSA